MSTPQPLNVPPRNPPRGGPARHEPALPVAIAIAMAIAATGADSAAQAKEAVPAGKRPPINAPSPLAPHMPAPVPPNLATPRMPTPPLRTLPGRTMPPSPTPAALSPPPTVPAPLAARPSARTPAGQPKPATTGTKPPAPSAPSASSPSSPSSPDDEADNDLYRCKKYPASARIKVTLKPETELKDLVTWVMGFTCRNFIYGSGIAGRAARVTIIAPSEMSPQDAYRLFLVALQTMNLTVVPKGKTMEIIESPRARESPIPIYDSPGDAPASDQIVRAIIRPEHVSVDDLNQVLAALKSKDGTVTPLPNSGIVLVTDTGNSLDQIVEVIREIDQPASGEKIFIIRLQNADAVELAQKLSEIFGGTGSSGGKSPTATTAKPRPRTSKASPAGGGQETTLETSAPSKMLAYERTNSIIVIASERAYGRILALVKRLDVPIEGGEGVIHVYPLENADSEELAGTLSALISGQSGARPTTRSGGKAKTAPASGTGNTGTGAAFEGTVRVTNDKTTNSLVIVSSVKDYVSLREVIRKLDVPRRQVFVEATILEVTLSKSRDIGTAFHGGKAIEGGIFDDATLIGGAAHGTLSSLNVGSLASLSGLAGALVGPTLEGAENGLGISIPSYGVMFQLLQNNSDVNVLSSPHILTSDNEAAEITVGTNIPYKSQISPLGSLPSMGNQQTGLSFSSFLGQSISREDLALKLKLTPHVNESDFVRLELEQEIKDIGDKDFEGLGPTWTTRTVKTMVVVKDQQPVVIGGLVSDRILESEKKVPLLGDIPIIGYLFKSVSRTKQKANLLVFLTPYIIHSQADLRRIYERKIEDRREFIETFTTFHDYSVEVDVDYGKKRGLIEEINKAVRTAEEDERLLRESQEAASRQEDEGPVEMPTELLPREQNSDGGGESPFVTEPAPGPPYQTPVLK
ncbi:MAG: type II secretion system secretin GspD [Pseudomonadota bacterium]